MAILPTKIQMRSITNNKLSIIDGPIEVDIGVFFSFRRKFVMMSKIIHKRIVSVFL